MWLDNYYIETNVERGITVRELEMEGNTRN
jgi:hypothetical protein